VTSPDAASRPDTASRSDTAELSDALSHSTSAPPRSTVGHERPAYDVARLRARFPALSEGAAHFDGPGGTQVPDVVADAVAGVLASAVSNRGRLTRSERRADEIVAAGRSAIADLVGADPAGVVYGRSMTALTYDFSRALAKTWGPGDEVVVTRLDHDADIRPWVQAAERAGARVRWVGFDADTGALGVGDVEAVLSQRTRLVACTGASNLIGTRPPIPEITAAAHRVGALSYVDGVHLSAHTLVDLGELGADFYACSPYKFFGPHCGFVAASADLLGEVHPDKLAPATDAIPERFELGTLPYELLAGVTAAVDFLADLVDSPPGTSRRERLRRSFEAVEVAETSLRRRIETAVADLPGVRQVGRAPERTPTLLFDFGGPARNDEAAELLAARGVNAPAGEFYALEASRWLGLGDTGALRVGLAPYNDDDEVDRLIAGLEEAASAPRR
jgi:cysteine desulfurase family protein (TIGR01976 family)